MKMTMRLVAAALALVWVFAACNVYIQRIDINIGIHGIPISECATPNGEVDVDSSAIELVALSIEGEATLGLSDYYVAISGANVDDGNVTPGSPNIFDDLQVILTADFYELNSECTPGSLLCSVAALVEVSGTFEGADPDDAFEAIAVDIGGGLQANLSCAAGPSWILGEEVAIDLAGVL